MRCHASASGYFGNRLVVEEGSRPGSDRASIGLRARVRKRFFKAPLLGSDSRHFLPKNRARTDVIVCQFHLLVQLADPSVGPGYPQIALASAGQLLGIGAPSRMPGRGLPVAPSIRFRKRRR